MESKSRPSLDNLNRTNVTKLLEIMQNLYIIWEDVGIDNEQELNRAMQVWNYVFELLNDIEKEEISLVKEIKERIKNYEKKISVLNRELQIQKAEEFTGSLIQKEQVLRELLDELSKMKHRRLRELEELRLQELKLSKVLGMSPINLKFSSQTGVPSEKDIYVLKEVVKTLQEEKEKRQNEFLRLKEEFNTILKVTELLPETSFEKEILTYQEDTFSLRMETLNQLKQVITETKKKQADLENEQFSLIQKLSALWDSLEISVEERELFLSKHTSYCISNLNALKNEITRCEEIKKQNFYKCVSSLKEELESLWNKCFIVVSENMLPQIQDEANKTILENYINEVKNWKKYHKDIEHIIEMIVKRQQLWDQLTTFESKAVDPSRYKNRGGKLLKEEKQRKQLTKTLPELEEKILNAIKEYEMKNGKQFLYYGEEFEHFIKKQWEDRTNQKENEKLTKKKMRLEKLITPSRQPFSLMTPKSTPSKILRSSRVSVSKTPVSAQSSRTPISCLRNEKKLANLSRKPKNSVMKEKNQNAPGSECLNCTTYSEFASKLNRTSRVFHRSSILSSKLAVRTRTKKLLHKKENISVQKSFRKK